MSKWRVEPVTATLGDGILIANEEGAWVHIPFADIEKFLKHVFSAATGREFMGAHYTTPRERAGDV